jgi:hypothetical protein
VIDQNRQTSRRRLRSSLALQARPHVGDPVERDAELDAPARQRVPSRTVIATASRSLPFR